MQIATSTERFSSRVQNYVRFRPSYPAKVLDLVKTECGFTPVSIVADVASGTGIFTKLLLENGNRVFGVEPNQSMRGAGEQYLAAYSAFASIAGTAEATTLADHSVDFVTAAQAAHWFDLTKTRKEFARILKPGGWVVMLWNERLVDSDPFHREYERLLLTYAIDYKEVRHEKTTAVIHEFFSPNQCQYRSSPNIQRLDYAGLEGRLLSSSYMPSAGHAKYQPMLQELRRIFEAGQSNGEVAMVYNTLVYFGQLA
jgi:ubiquinone/menaquinone biosynthesis C-methylase UbiE